MLEVKPYHRTWRNFIERSYTKRTRKAVDSKTCQERSSIPDGTGVSVCGEGERDLVEERMEFLMKRRCTLHVPFSLQNQEGSSGCTNL
jgi:hypothetical protein